MEQLKKLRRGLQSVLSSREEPADSYIRQILKELLGEQEELLRISDRSLREEKRLKETYLELALAFFREHIEVAQGNISIISGWLSPLVYNQIVGDLRYALRERPELEVKIITGPTVLLAMAEDNRLYEMYERREWDERLQIRSFPIMRPGIPHIRMVDYTLSENGRFSIKRFLWEKPHSEPNISPREIAVLENYSGYQVDRVGAHMGIFNTLWGGLEKSSISPRLQSR